jgi:Mg2+-importing ATPase
MAMSTNFGPMCSMVGASLIVPFLPLLPQQVLLNNLLYDFSVLPIPMDNIDADYVARLRKWDMTFVRNFMICMAPALTGFDFLTFLILLRMLLRTKYSFTRVGSWNRRSHTARHLHHPNTGQSTA